MLKFDNKLNLDLDTDRIVVVSGKISINKKSLKPGSLISSTGETSVKIFCETEECILYLKPE